MTIVRNWWSHLHVFAVDEVRALLIPSTASTARSLFSVATRFQGAPNVTVTVMRTELSITPSSLSVPPGKPVTFIVTNTGGAQHTLTVEFEGQGIKQQLFDTSLMPGETGQAIFTFTAPGQWIMYCPVGNHRALGMQGTISVAQAATPTPTVAPTATPQPPTPTPIAITPIPSPTVAPQPSPTAAPTLVPSPTLPPPPSATPTLCPQVVPATGRAQRGSSTLVALVGLALLLAVGVTRAWAARRRTWL
ncbi:cupredoxin domain-containing protein [Thermomicrobium sp. CFH 73360]|uniref:plastocyanin/azurin family copper-binding protein n=1 Tax=Thermomicrobium sp. CFH 73360 TaxID=2951987 RepID=UPI00207697D1|nr:cupredoxin domain-containing protein [Thermomicrobium sp. CFH 73360]MCM8745203.1 cupredoxin domain-containing protein [Thermomicrobium sp. CFH 73360]